MVQIPRLIGIASFYCLALGVTSQAAQDTAAALLWKSFLETYRNFSYKPLDPETLDAKARAVLIKVSGPRFRSLKPDEYPSLPELATAMAAKDDSMPEFERVELGLQALLPEIDRYGHYQSASDVAQLNEALKQGGGSVHMTLDNSQEGEILCFPYDAGPAQLAGIGGGAQLLEVDGRPAQGKSLHSLRLAFVGPPDTIIELKVRQPHGKVEVFKITRTAKSFPNVSVEKTPLGVTLRIRKFASDTASQVKAAMQPYGQPKRLTIDLRGNPGGLREEALKVASLFFPKGTALAKFTTQSGVQTASDGNDIFIIPGAIRILQDSRTASAAEYLVAALKEGLPHITTVFGEISYGKSHSTALISLSGGGQLSVTEAMLATGSGQSWDKSGISPENSPVD
jgi:carboxyl-terminal processing protease